MNNKPAVIEKQFISETTLVDGYDAVGAYVWSVLLNEGDDPILVLTNDPVPDNDFKTIIDHYRKKISNAKSITLESIKVETVNLIGFAQGTARHEASKPPALEYSDGRVLISPEFAAHIRSFADKMSLFNSSCATSSAPARQTMNDSNDGVAVFADDVTELAKPLV